MTVLLVVTYLAVSYGAARWLWAYQTDAEDYDRPLFLLLGLLWPITLLSVLAMRLLPSKKP